MRFASVLRVALVLGLAVPAFGQGTFELTYTAFGDEQDRLAQFGRQWLAPQGQRPDTLKGVPESLSAEAVYFVGQAAGETVFVAVEPEALTVYVDADLDGDLADEQPVKLVEGEEGRRPCGTLSVKRQTPDAVPVDVFVLPYASGGEVRSVAIGPAGAYRAEVTLGGKQCKVAVVDATLNGHPSDAFVFDEPHDMLHMDLNDDGVLDYWQGEFIPLPAAVSQDDVFYSVSVADDGSTITFTRVTPALGTLKASTPGLRATVWSEAGIFRLNPRETGDGTWPLPAGRYRFAILELCERDDEDHVWTAGCLAMNDVEWFDMREGETTALKLGPPLALKVNVSERDRTVNVGLELWGQGGERYYAYMRTDEAGAGLGTLKILDESGAELEAGKFRYG